MIHVFVALYVLALDLPSDLLHHLKISFSSRTRINRLSESYSCTNLHLSPTHRIIFTEHCFSYDSSFTTHVEILIASILVCDRFGVFGVFDVFALTHGINEDAVDAFPVSQISSCKGKSRSMDAQHLSLVEQASHPFRPPYRLLNELIARP